MDSRAWDERYRAAGLMWKSAPNQFLVEEVAGLEPGRALDLACGEGRNAIWLAEQGWQVVGVDFSAVALEKARGMAAERGVEVVWELADLTSYPPEQGCHDLVIVMYLHLPVGELQRVLRTASASLATGGTLLVVGHDVTNLTEGWGGPRDPQVLYEPERVAASLAPLQVVSARRVRRDVVDEAGEARTAVDTLVRAVRIAG